MEKLRLTCAADTETVCLRKHLADMLEDNFEIHFSSIDRSQRQVLEKHKPDVVFIDCEMMNQEQRGDLSGFLRMLNKHFPQIPVIIRAPTSALEQRMQLEEISTPNVLGFINTDRAYEYIPKDVERIIGFGKQKEFIYIHGAV